MLKERIQWVDIAKGFFILFIVIGHVFSDGVLRRYVFSFHVPAFFFMSGYCFNACKNKKDFVIGKIRTIVVPYITFSLISILLFVLVASILPKLNEIMQCGIFTNIKCMLYGSSKPAIMKYNQPLWFLPCLFCVSIVAYTIETIGGGTTVIKNLYRCGAMLIGTFAGIFFSFNVDIALPWHFETSLSMLVWFEAGVIVRDNLYHFDMVRVSGLQKFIIVFCLLICGYLIQLLNIRTVGVRNEHYGIIGIYYLSAALSIIGFSILAKIMKHNVILEYMGKNSLIILVLHKFPILVFQEMISYTKNVLEGTNIMLKYGCGFLIVIVAITFSLVTGKIINIIFPWALGQRKR